MGQCFFYHLFLSSILFFKRFTIVSFQIAFVLFLQNNIRYDALWILNQAIKMLDTHEISPTMFDSYFSQVPNNYGFTLITYWFLNILKMLGLPHSCFMRAVQFLNIVFIDLSVLFIYLFIRKARGNAASVFFLFFCAISPFLYVWTPYYYTSTASMTFACAAIWVWFCIRNTSSLKKKLFLAGLMGILCITGFKVRATSLIPYIAIVLYWSIDHKKDSLRKNIRPIAVFILSAFLTLFCWKGIINHYVPFDTKDTALPVTHFIMLGTFGDSGSFDKSDLLYTLSLPTAEEKLEGTVSVIRQRLVKNGLSGNIRLLLNKQLNTWEDGTDFYAREHTLCTDFNRFHTYIIGSKSGYLASYAQIFRGLQLFLTCVYCIFAFLHRKTDPIFFLALNLLGGMGFHLLWEAGPFYSIAFTLFSYALATEGISQLNTYSLLKKRPFGGFMFFSSLFCFLLSAFFLVTQVQAYTQDLRVMTDFVVNQHMAEEEKDSPLITQDQVWTQTFEAETIFNVLDLYFICPNQKKNTSVYNITLTDEHGETFYNDMLYGNKMGYDLFYEIQFDPIIPSGKTSYTITIKPIVQTKEHYVHFCSHDASYVDLYPHGSLSIDGRPTKRDLSFRILSHNIGTAASKKEYGLFTILLLSLELFLIVKSFRFIHKKRRPVT